MGKGIPGKLQVQKLGGRAKPSMMEQQERGSQATGREHGKDERQLMLLSSRPRAKGLGLNTSIESQIPHVENGGGGVDIYNQCLKGL